MAHQDPYVDMVARYVKRFSGCGFASSLVLRGVLWVRVTHPVASDVRLAIETASLGSKAAGLVFPSIRTPAEIEEFVAELLTDERWVRQDVPRVPGAFGLWWRSADMETTSCAMGLAPLPSMPVTRRAPYTSLIVWDAGRQNPYAKRRKGQPVDEIGLTDMPTGLAQAEYDRAWRAVRGETARIRTELADDTFGPEVTFVL
ncbi:MAG TPA: hypothetical protein PK095_00105 [Myxococcota bacterium]|nr:hypothetical protein [Myxococcota bacterium]